MFEAIVVEHGVDALNAMHVAIARSLARALCQDEVDAKVVADLSALLPSKSAPDGNVLDITKLTDQELDVLEAAAERIGNAPAPAPNTPEAQINELLEMNRGLRELVDRTEERARQSAQAEEMMRRLMDAAVARCREVEAQLASVQAVVAPSSSPSLPAVERPDNVIELRPAVR
jgi:hypothetical protein